MILDTLAAMADKANDDAFNFNSTAAQALETLTDVKNTGTKTVINYATKSGDSQIQNETLTVGSTTIVNNQLDDLKHVIVGMQLKQPLSVVEANQQA